MIPDAEGNTLSRLIATARANVPMREVARRSGLSAAQISRIEAGSVESPTIETLTRIATALDRDPQLLLIALGRVEGTQALRHVQQALEAPGTGGAREEQRAQLAKRQKRVEELENLLASSRNEWQTLAGRHDVLTAEQVELYQQAEYFARAAGENNDQPELADEYRARVKAAETDLERVQSELKAFERQGHQVRDQLEKHEAILDEARERLAKTVQAVAAQLFVDVLAPPASELQAMATLNELLASSEKARAVLDARLHSLIAELGAKASRAATEEFAGEVQRQLEQVQKQISEQLIDATRHLRNQLVHQPGDADFRRLAAAWNRLTPERRERVLEFVEDQRRLSLQERLEQGGLSTVAGGESGF